MLGSREEEIGWKCFVKVGPWMVCILSVTCIICSVLVLYAWDVLCGFPEAGILYLC